MHNPQVRPKWVHDSIVLIWHFKLLGIRTCINLPTGQKLFSERVVSKIFKEIVESLIGIHDRDMIVLDIKMDNLMFTNMDEMKIKIVDFGLAVPLMKRDKHFDTELHGNKSNLAPESIVAYRRDRMAVYSKASDMWQAGFLLYTLLYGVYPFEVEDDILLGKALTWH